MTKRKKKNNKQSVCTGVTRNASHNKICSYSSLGMCVYMIKNVLYDTRKELQKSTTTTTTR